MAFSPIATSFSETLSHYFPTVLQFFLEDKIYPNNSVVALINIGEGRDSLFCLNNSDIEEHEDPWIFPNESSVSNDSTRGFYTNISHNAVLLNCRSNAVGPTGLFTCRVLDGNGVYRKIYIGVNLGISVLL